MKTAKIGFFLGAAAVLFISCVSEPNKIEPGVQSEDPRVKELSAQILDLSGQIKEKDKTLETLVSERDGLGKARAESESRLAEEKARAEGLGASLAAKTRELESLSTEKTAVDSELSGKTAQYDRTAREKAELESLLAQKSAQIDALSREKGEFDGKLAQKSSQIDALTKTKAELELRLTQKTASADSLSTENKRMWADFDNYRTRIAALESEIVDLKKEAASNAAKINGFDAKVGNLNKTNADLQAALNSKKGEIEGRLASLSAEKDSLSAKVDELEKTKKLLEEALERDSLRLASVMNQLAGALINEIAKDEIEIYRYDSVVVVSIKDSVLFAPDRPELRPEYENVLKSIATIFKKLPDKVIRVEGNTAVAQSSPEIMKLYPTSWHLGAARAANVVNFLQEKCGIDPLQLVAASLGEYRPIASNATEEGKQKNRRVQFVLIDRPLWELDQLKRSGN